MGVKENQELLLQNVLSFRGKVTQRQMQEEMMKIGQVLQNLGAQKNGPITTATYTVEQAGNEQLMDIEILVPLDRQVNLPNEYNLKPIIKIVNALSIRHEGHPGKLQETIDELNEYIIEHAKQVITPTYNVTVKDVERQEDLDQMIIDIYVGINSNIL